MLNKAKLAYAIWPWGLAKKEQMAQALKDVKEVGYHYFESVESAVTLFQDDQAGFKRLTDEYQVYPASFYFWQRGDYEKDVNTVRQALDFMNTNNVKRMSVQAPGKKGGATPAELQHVLKTCAAIGKLTKPHGIVPCIHPHANTMVMYKNEIDFIMQNTNPDEIGFGPDTAHLTVGRCDAVEIYDRYAARIKFTHLKDVKKNKAVAGDGAKKEGFEIYSDFLEMGEGDVDFDGIFKVLDKVGYAGYLTAEIDRSRFGNRRSAEMNMAFFRKHGLK